MNESRADTPKAGKNALQLRDPDHPSALSRRDFLAATAGALGVGLWPQGGRVLTHPSMEPAGASLIRPLRQEPFDCGPSALAGRVERGVPGLEPQRPWPGRWQRLTPLDRQQGILTPNGLCFTHAPSGIPELDARAHRLSIQGLVQRPLLLSLAELARMPAVRRPYFLECAANGACSPSCEIPDMTVAESHGRIHCCMYTGVPLRLLLERAGVDPRARWMVARGADGDQRACALPLTACLEEGILAFAQNGKALCAEQGYPLRLVLPGLPGCFWVKWLRELELCERPPAGALPASIDMDEWPAVASPPLMAVKSVITFPAPGSVLDRPGPYPVRGFAWSGRGRILKVELSADGGRSWHAARLVEPILPKCLTRFEAMWEWDGRPAVLISRALDESGALQPTLHELHAVDKGLGFRCHNGQQPWLVDRLGQVRALSQLEI